MPLALLIAAGFLASVTAPPVDTVKVGEMKLCKPNVTSASIGSDQYTGKPVAIITLNDKEKVALGDLTRRDKGKQLPITLNGDVIASPRIEEAIYGGVFTISGPDKIVLERVVSAALSVC